MRLLVWLVRGMETTTISACPRRSSRRSIFQTESKFSTGRPEVLIPMVRMLKALATLATDLPIPPAPIIPIVFPRRRIPSVEPSKTPFRSRSWFRTRFFPK